MTKQHGNTKNRNAAKGDENLSAFIAFRTTPTQKAAWLQAANGEKLEVWIKRTLDKASDLTKLSNN